MGSLTFPVETFDAAVGAYRAAASDPRVPAKVRSHDLRHMAFWHSYYAATVHALVAGETPDVLRGPYKVINRHAQDLNAGLDDDAALAMINQAHRRLLDRLPLLPDHAVIPYKKGSRRHRRDDYITTLAEHFDMHVRYLQKIAAGAPESFLRLPQLTGVVRQRRPGADHADGRCRPAFRLQRPSGP